MYIIGNTGKGEVSKANLKLQQHIESLDIMLSVGGVHFLEFFEKELFGRIYHDP